MDDQVGAHTQAWQHYTDRRRVFSTAFWLHYLLGLAGAHRLYIGRHGSGIAQLLLGLCSFVAMMVLLQLWGTGAAVFMVPLAICGLWLWWDTYNLRDMVRERNRALAIEAGLDPAETERWEDAQAAGGG